MPVYPHSGRVMDSSDAAVHRQGRNLADCLRLVPPGDKVLRLFADHRHPGLWNEDSDQ